MSTSDLTKKTPDLTKETLIAVADVHRHVPGKRRLHRAIGYRWTYSGVRNIRLASILLGGRRYTSLEALHRFFAETTAGAPGGSHRSPPSPSVVHADREEAIDRAERELREQGL